MFELFEIEGVVNPVEEAKATMARCWNEYDEAMKRGEDVEVNLDYIEAECFLKSLDDSDSDKCVNDTYMVIIDGVVVEKKIVTFADAMNAWETDQLYGYEVPDYISSREDAKIAFEAGILDKDGFEFFDSMIYSA